MKKISAIIPAYNCDKFIESTIKSIQEQNYENIEILIINDGSTDNTLQICEKLASIDDRICIINQINSGVSKARNTGLDHATGDYIHFVDADDKLVRNLYSKISQYLDDDYDVIRFDYKKNNEKDIEFKTLINNVNHEEIENQIIKKILKFEMTAYVWQILFKNTKNVRFNEKLKTIEDNAFCIELFFNCNSMLITNEKLYEYNVTNMNSATRNIDKTRIMMENLLVANTEIKKLLYKLLPSKKEYIEILDSYNFHFYCNYFEILYKNLKSKKKTIGLFKEMDNLYNIKEIFNNFNFSLLCRKHQITTKLTMKKKYNTLWLLYKLKNLVICKNK